MLPLHGVVRHYPWGSLTEIPNLLGLPADGRPWAELWLGAHPIAPSTVGDEAQTLDQLIHANPSDMLGPQAAANFAGLPFLTKVLAAAKPLSLQAHPSAAQARAGFKREEALGIALDAPNRSFRDRSHKPELICALSEFHALCGLREPADTLALLDSIETHALDPVRRRLTRDPSPKGLGELVGWLLRLSRSDASAMVEPVVQACTNLASAADSDADAGTSPADGRSIVPDTRAAIAALGACYPHDAGVIVALLLNHVVLAPGEALFLAAGNLHCYLGGTALEVMACSDNVLRGGLTNKHIDVDTLLEVIDATPAPVTIQRPRPVDGIASYHTDVPEFSLRRLDITPSHHVKAPGGPAVMVCTKGSARLGDHRFGRGDALWVSASEKSIVVTGQATVFHVGLGRAPTASR